MPKINLTDTEVRAVIHALGVAAERFDEDAKTMAQSDIPAEGRARLVRTFEDQAAVARKIAEKLEEVA